MRALLNQSQRSIIMQELDPATNQTIVWKICSPAKNTVNDLANEFDITQSITFDGIRKPLRRGLYQNKEAFAYAFFDGVSLRQHRADRSLTLIETLTIAVNLANLLKQLHQQGVFHLRLNSHHVLYQPITGKLQLIDFSLASRQPTNRALDFQDWGDELAYVAPEQMGRWSQAADNRTDLYSFGVILYELLTRHLPFIADDTAKLVHFHLVRVPTAPHLIDEGVPLMLSKVVEKLLAKRADERYQTAHGVLQDLQQCLDDLRHERPLQLSELGLFDGSGRLQLSTYLHGRDAALAQAEADFDQVSKGQNRLYLVSGESGTGKTALVQHLKRQAQRQDSILLTAHCEPADRAEPYGPFLTGLRELATNLLALPDKQLHTWQSVLQLALGEQEPVLTQLVPAYYWILEPDGAARPISNRPAEPAALPALFQRLVRGLMNLSRPVVLVVEDIHQADTIVWSSLEAICQDAATTRLLLVVTTRPPAQDQALTDRLRHLRAQIPAGHSVDLMNLTQSDVRAFLNDSLLPDSVDAFSQLVYAKTAGNPNFLRQFLATQFADKHLWFDADRLRWAWNPDRLTESTPTDNVVDQVVGELAQLPPEPIRVLRLAACFSTFFTATALAEALALSEHRLSNMLSELVDGQILVQATAGYRFTHDRIRTAVYNSTPETERNRLHYTIACLLLAQADGGNPTVSVYDLAAQFTLGSSQLPESARFFIVEMNLKAGLSARQAADFQQAYRYFTNGIRLLTEADWSDNYETTLALVNQATEVGMITGIHTEAEQWLQESLRRARTIDDRIKAHEIKLNQLSENHQFAETIEHMLAVMKEIGHGIPRHPSKLATFSEFARVYWLLRNKTTATIPKMPLMQDERARAFMRMVINSATSVYGSAPELVPILYFRCVRLSLLHGLSLYAPFAFIGYATIQLFLGSPRKGYAYGKMALQLTDQLQAEEVRAKVMVTFYGFISFWRDSLRQSIEPLREAYWIGRKNGDLQYAAFALSFHTTVRLHAGDNLVELLDAMTRDNQLILEMKQTMVYTVSEAQQQVILRLVQGTASLSSPQDEDFDESALLARLETIGDQATKFDFYFHKLMLACLFNHYPEAFAASQLASQYEEDNTTSRQSIYPVFLVFSTIADIKQARRGQVPKLNRQITRKIKQMGSFAKEAPQNYAHKYALLQALWHEDQGPHSTTTEYYEKAIAQARINNFSHEEALAREHFARFLLQTGQSEYGVWMLQKAYQGYQKWGAAAKCSQLEKEKPTILSELITAGKGLTIANFQDRYDLAAIIQANQMLSSENTLDGLLRRMIEIVIQNASATHVVILLKDADQQLRPKAVGTNQAVQIMTDTDDSIRYSQSVIQYFSRTGAGFVSHNVSTDPQFMLDAYIQATRPISVCCLPINTQNSLLGVLYLENNLAEAAFDAKRVDFFATLSSQLAISLDNVFLYQEMEDKVQQRTQALEQSLSDLRVTQTQLIQKEKMASLGELTAGIAHEIQNPLNFVNNFSEVSAELVQELKDEVKAGRTEDALAIADDLEQNLQKITHHGKRADAIVKGMLEHSRGSSGEKQFTDLNALTSEYLRLTYQGLRAKDNTFTADLRLNLDAQLEPVYVAAQDISRVLLNLFNNAFYAVQEKQKIAQADYHPTVTVSTMRVNNNFQIQVRDNGVGIPDPIKAKVFQPFFTTKPTGEGTGLGLSLSYDIVTKGHGGEMWVDSEKDQYTEMVVHLPLSR